MEDFFLGRLLGLLRLAPKIVSNQRRAELQSQLLARGWKQSGAKNFFNKIIKRGLKF